MPYEGQRCFLTTVWLIGVYCTRCALCIAHSKGHWLSGSLLWDSKSISKFWGGGPNFHAFNESRQPWAMGAGVANLSTRRKKDHIRKRHFI